MASPRRSIDSAERQASPTATSDPAPSSNQAPASQPAAPVEPWADPSVFATVSSHDPAAPVPATATPGSSPPAPAPGRDATADSNPRIPWTGRIPAFFQLAPDGSLIPHFPAPPPSTASTQPNTGSNNADTPRAQPTAPPAGGDEAGSSPAPSAMPHFHLPPLPADGRFPPFFPFMMPIAGLRNRRPDPEAAAELLRSLPTVEQGLFRRVERVTIAEQVQNEEDGEEPGWKCGICLEGRDLEAKETGIKALPCNHLFHGDCLEPWFTTNHTCPTCRLDLDPLKTLRRNRVTNAGRPGATGSGRSTPHPYARPGGATPPAVGIEAGSGPGDGPSFTFIWQMPLPAEVAPPAPAAPTGGAQGTTVESVGTAPVVPAPAPDRPQTPTLRFTFPLSSSPLPINRERSASPFTRTDNPATPTPPAPAQLPTESGADSAASAPSTDSRTAATTAAASEGGVPRPQPRRHITVIHHHHPSPSAPDSPHHHHHVHPHPASPHHHHHHHLRPPGASTPIPVSSTPPPGEEALRTVANADAASGPAEGGQETGAASPDSRGPVTPTDQSAANNGPSARPHFHFFFNISDQPLGGMPLPTAPGADSAAQSEPAEQPAQPERPSLSEWVAARERSLGWRCDAPDCGIAPSDDDGDDTAMPAEEDKEMLSIYSMLQPPATVGSPIAGKKGFELLSCEHRWHRSCLETVERTAGRNSRPDAEGRVSVRCEACRKEGWIWPRSRSMSEGEVEALCAAR